ncbi:MAG: ABC transporter ATP-binding protein, partial [Gammaproteobacteria bacterium]
MAQVRYRHVYKTYAKGTPALIDFDLQVRDGEFMVLVGPSGCGKSTALRLLAGLESVTAGNILIDDEVIDDKPPQQRNIAMVFQNYALYPHMTVRQNLAFPLKMMKCGHTEIEQRVQQAAALLELAALLERKPG